MISKTVKPATYMRTSFAFLIDSAIAIGFMLLTYFLVGEKFMLPSLGYQKQVDAYCQYSADSGLASLAYKSDGVTIDAANTYIYKTVETLPDGSSENGYRLYEKIVWNYYTVFLPSRGDDVKGVAASVYYTPEFVTKSIYGLKDDGTGNDYYVPAPDGQGGFDFSSQPILSSSTLTQISKETASGNTVQKLLYFFRSAGGDSGLYVDAIVNFKSQASYSIPIAACDRIKYLATIPAILGPSLIFFFIIPLAVPNGRTLGKLMLGLAVLGDDGYKAHKINIVLHYFIIMLIYEVLLLPDQIIGFPLFALLFIIDYVVLVLSKKHQSIHDMLSKTVVVDAKASVWFSSKEAEQDYVLTHPSSLAAQVSGVTLSEDKPIERRLVATDEQIAAADSILDLSTINKNRDEARNMNSFDEFEAKKDVNVTLETPIETKTMPEDKNGK